MKSLFAFVRTWHRPLMVCSMLMLGLMLVCGVGLVIDSRTLHSIPN